MPADLVMLCPTRGRPAAARELADAWPEFTTAGAQLMLLIDHDDPERAAYEAIGGRDGVYPYTGPAARVGPWLNRMAPKVAETGAKAVGFLGDDHRPRTKGWDARFLAALDGMGGGVVYGNDLYQRERIPTAVAISAPIVRELGGMVPSGLEHLYLDNFWAALGTQLDRLAYLDDVIIEHVHPLAGKAAWDAGYARVNGPDQYARDAAAFRAYLAAGFADDVERVRGCLAPVP
jgi:hypothetical protein